MTAILTTSRIAGQGDAVADTNDGPVFISGALPGELVEGEVRDGRIESPRILTPSPDRVQAPCPHFGTCGGCALQQWAERPYLDWKAEQVRQLLQRQGLSPRVAPTTAVPSQSRRRLALHARRDPSGRVRLGFKPRRSWQLVEIQACPVANPKLVDALPVLRQIADAVLEHPKSAPTLHVTWTLTGLDVDITGVERKSGGLARDRLSRAITVAMEGDVARLSLAGEVLFMARPPQVQFGRATVTLPPGGFVQAVPEAEAAMVDRVRAAVIGHGRVADLFCGAGTFTFPLAEQATVLAADGAGAAIEALKAGRATADGLRPIEATARDLFRRPLSPHDLKGITAVVLDPPRAGATEQVAQLPGSDAQVIAYVSCNPQTFARDARALVDGGFTLEQVAPIDQFLWSGHVELVGVFRR